MVVKIVSTLLTLAVSVLGAALPGITPPAVLDHDLSNSAAGSGNPISCAHAWCQDGISMCGYWAGITGWDDLQGPRPGWINTAVGPCTQSSETPQPNADKTHVYGSQGENYHDEDRPTATVTSILSHPDDTKVYDSTTTGQAAETATKPMNCAKKYCNEYGSLICHYWADVTAWDVNMGIVPGMTVTNMGPCPTQTQDDLGTERDW
ncbi:hypothetical protein ACRALDRAFT_1072137 [Sodiomyces alcalophilus JCM 7366]|uniref:uncharacterized protein n=1 Tax=Sodiomyces alcalophilus JCM 7366 TaxID=591952 RepID=UPI0039B5E2D1